MEQTGIEGRIVLNSTTTEDDWLASAERWRQLRATHLALTYESGRFLGLDQVSELLSRFVPHL